MRPNTKDYDQAVQTGVEAAMMGMQVQADAIRRAQEMGLGAPAAGMPALPHMTPQTQPQFPHQLPGQVQFPPSVLPVAPSLLGGSQPMAGADSFAECVSAMSSRVRATTGQNPTPTQNAQILQQCQ